MGKTARKALVLYKCRYVIVFKTVRKVQRYSLNSIPGKNNIFLISRRQQLRSYHQNKERS